MKPSGRTAVLATAAVAMVLVVSGCGAQQAAGGGGITSGSTTAGQSPANVQVVHVVATDFRWTMDKTTLSVGKPVEFDVTSQQGMHGFSIVGTSISQPVSAGQNITVDWTPPKAGQYEIKCDIYCGSGHPNMQTMFTVQ